MRRTFRHMARNAGLMMTTLAVLGCSGTEDDLPRMAIDGRVTWDGKPLDRGMIRFEPAAGNRPQVQAGGPIEGGSYRVGRAEGPVPGTYSVSISTVFAAAADLEDDQARKVVVPPDPIPPRYNRKTTLKVEVKADGPTRFDFDLTADK